MESGKKLLRRSNVFRTLVAIMFFVVLYDSFTHNKPFYYICFLILGVLIGQIISITDRVSLEHQPCRRVVLGRRLKRPHKQINRRSR